MVSLNENWLTQGLMDLEYKKYVLMAYMRDVKKNFDSMRLYPFLSDLVFHYTNLKTLKENKKLIYQNFPKEISRADFEKLKISYRQIVGDDQLMQVIEDIINFSLPQLKSCLDEGAGIYEEIAHHIVIEPIGISPLFTNEGYLMIGTLNSNEVHIYRYKITVFNRAEESYRAISTEFLDATEKSLINTYEHIKGKLIKQYRALPNPATFLALSRLHCPLNETLLPITKRLLVQHLEKAA